MLRLLALITLTVGIINGPYPLQAFTIETTTCNTADFADESCILECKVNVTDTSTTQLKSCSWEYFTNDDTRKYTFYDGVDLVEKDNAYTVSLTLTNYSSGHYRCILTLSTDEILSNTFQINDTIKGVDLNGECSDSSECLILNAVCEENAQNVTVCQCLDYFYLNEYYVPACLAHQENGSHCNIIDECMVATESYDCVNTYCECTGVMTNVSADGTDALKCISPEWLMDECYYDEQCTMRADHSFCEHQSNSCECVPPYVMWMPPGTAHKDMYCYIETPAPTTVSPAPPAPGVGTTVSNSVGNMVVVSIIWGLINYILQKRN